VLRRTRQLLLFVVAGVALAACGATAPAAPTPTLTPRPIIISSSPTPGGNAPPRDTGPAVPNSTILTPFATSTQSAPTATALLTVVAGTPPNQIKIVDFSFDPPNLTGTISTTITWTNAGPSNHTVTANDGSFDSGTILTNAKYTFTPTKAGTYAYHCSIHPTMTGTLVIR